MAVTDASFELGYVSVEQTKRVSATVPPQKCYNPYVTHSWEVLDAPRAVSPVGYRSNPWEQSSDDEEETEAATGTGTGTGAQLALPPPPPAPPSPDESLAFNWRRLFAKNQPVGHASKLSVIPDGPGRYVFRVTSTGFDSGTLVDARSVSGARDSPNPAAAEAFEPAPPPAPPMPMPPSPSTPPASTALEVTVDGTTATARCGAVACTCVVQAPSSTATGLPLLDALVAALANAADATLSLETTIGGQRQQFNVDYSTASRPHDSALFSCAGAAVGAACRAAFRELGQARVTVVRGGAVVSATLEEQPGAVVCDAAPYGRAPRGGRLRVGTYRTCLTPLFFEALGLHLGRGLRLASQRTGDARDCLEAAFAACGRLLRVARPGESISCGPRTGAAAVGARRSFLRWFSLVHDLHHDCCYDSRRNHWTARRGGASSSPVPLGKWQNTAQARRGARFSPSLGSRHRPPPRAPRRGPGTPATARRRSSTRSSGTDAVAQVGSRRRASLSAWLPPQPPRARTARARSPRASRL